MRRSKWNPPRELRDALAERDGMACHWCGVETVRMEPGSDGRQPDNAMTLDHVHERSRGGSDEAENLVIACYRCNQFRAKAFSGSPGELTEQQLVALMRGE